MRATNNDLSSFLILLKLKDVCGTYTCVLLLAVF